MKPPPFEYLRAESVTDVWNALDQGDDVKVIAGGQSLVPLLSLRLASPSLLVDIGGLDELKGVQCDGQTLRLGALTRHVEVETHPLVSVHAPLLACAASWVAHPQVRNRGTLGGSVAHGDSAAELPAALLALDAVVIASSREGQRRIKASDFFASLFTTVLAPGELVSAVEVAVQPALSSWGFEEFARRRGDYAIGGAAVYAERHSDGRCKTVRAGLIAAGPTPRLAPCVSERMTDQVIHAAIISDVVEEAMQQVMTSANVHASSDYRKTIVAEMLRRALTSAFTRDEAA